MFASPRNNLRAAISKCLSLSLSILSPLVIAHHIAFGASSSATLTVTATVVRTCHFFIAHEVAAVAPTGSGQWFDTTGTERSGGPCHERSNAPRITIRATNYHVDHHLGVAKSEVRRVSDRVQTELVFTNTAAGMAVKLFHRVLTIPLAPRVATPSAGDWAPESGVLADGSGNVAVTIDF